MPGMLADIPLPGTEDTLVGVPTADGLAYMASIRRERTDGSTVWTASPPNGESQDAWTAVRLDGQHLVANSWSGYLVELNVESGQEVTRTFTK